MILEHPQNDKMTQDKGDHSHSYHRSFEEHMTLWQKAQQSLEPAFDEMVCAVIACLKNGGKLLFCGNGGSAGDSQHLATEFVVKFKKPRKALPALALTTDSSALTAIGNDFGFDHLFSRQIEALGDPGDVLFAISTSGTSPNILQAADQAKKQGLFVIAFTGQNVTPLTEKAHVSLMVPSTTVSRIQEMHIFLGQMLVECVENAMGLS